MIAATAADVMVDIWIQWWSSAGDEAPVRPTGHWIGIYALLQILPLLTLCLWLGLAALTAHPGDRLTSLDTSC